jgi:catechol 2,3-dioxygenase-like lactoylglutathione lyase family enzyme
MNHLDTTPEQGAAATGTDVQALDFKLEAIVLPVSDVDRAKHFYDGLGWRLDADIAVGEFRVIQFTPPGSGASILFGRNVTAATPGSSQGLYLVVSDNEYARAELLRRGVEVSEAFHFEASESGRRQVSGPDPKRPSYGTYAAFTDPDGNLWLLQQVTARLPGRIDSGVTSFTSVTDLAGALRRAAIAHGEHEKKIGHHDAGWPDWYAAYMVAEQAGTPLPD